MERPRLVGALVRVSTKVVALGLEQVGGQAGAAVAVEVGEGGGEGGDRNAEVDGGRDYVPPVRLRGTDRVAEVGIEQRAAGGEKESEGQVRLVALHCERIALVSAAYVRTGHM